MTDIARRRAVFAALMGAYHNSFANEAVGSRRHSATFIDNALALKEAADTKDVLRADPALTSTDAGAVAVGIAKTVMQNARCASAFIDIELGESAVLCYFDKSVKPEVAIDCVSASGKVAQLAKPGDQLGEGQVSDLLILAIEPAQAVAEALLKDAKQSPALSDEQVKAVVEFALGEGAYGKPVDETLQGCFPTPDDIAAYKAGYADGYRRIPAQRTADKAYVQGYDHGFKMKRALYEGKSADALAHMLRAFGGIPTEPVLTKNETIDAIIARAVAARGKLNESAEAFEDLSDKVAVELDEKLDEKTLGLVVAAATDMPAAQVAESFKDEMQKAVAISRASKRMLVSAGVFPAALAESVQALRTAFK